MIFDRDIKQLKSLAKYFFDIARVPINIYDEGKNSVCSYSKSSKAGEFCSFIRKNKYINEKCIECDKRAFEECEKRGETYVYKCHMGLTEVATPIIYNNIILGYMLFGQITDNKDKGEIYKAADRICEEYGFKKEALYEKIGNIKYRSKDYINSISTLLEMCSNYIWMKDFISVKNEDLAYRIDCYIKENIGEELSVSSICKEFSISRSALYNLWKRNFGKGVSEYILDIRIEKAKEMLKNGEGAVGNVANRLGFTDVSYFIRIFKAKTGITPKKFQINHKK